MTTTLRPLENHVLLICLADDDKTPGGIIIPDVAKGKERPRRGRIVRVGPGPKRGKRGGRCPMELAGKEGATVLYDEFSVAKEMGDLRLDDCKHVIINEDGIMGVLIEHYDDDGAKSWSLMPLHDRVLVRPAEAEKETPGGIIIPDVAEGRPTLGAVVNLGLGKADDNGVVVPLDVEAGDLVWFGKYAGTKLTLDGLELLLMREEEILAVDEELPF